MLLRDGAHTRATIGTDEPRRGGGSTSLIVLAVLVLSVLAFLARRTMSGAEEAKDNAVATAAGNVGSAEGKVGDASRRHRRK